MTETTLQFVKLTTERLKGSLTSVIDLGKLFEKQLADIPKSQVNDRYNAERQLKDIVDVTVHLKNVISTLEELK